MKPAKPSPEQDALWSQNPSLQRPTVATGQERLDEEQPVPVPYKPKVMVATEPGTEYWLP